MARTARRRQRGPARATAAVEGGQEPRVRRGPAPARDRRTWLVAVPLVLLVVLAFLPALDGGFVDWDDEANFLRNPLYRGLGWAQVRWAWSTVLLGVYQPVSWLLLEAQYVVWRLDPRGYHLTSLLLHAANTVALYALTMALLVRCRPDPFRERPWACALGAGLATALFAVHPLRVEAVAWASCQPYLPCALFSMLTVLAYLRGVGDGDRTRPGWLGVSFVLFVAALLSKAPAVSLPAVLLILDVYPLGRLGGGRGRWLGPAARRVWLEKVPFVAASLAFTGLAIAAKARAGSVLPLDQGGLAARVAQACYGTWFYLVKTAIPLEITAFYPLPEPIDWRAPAFLASIVATVTVTIALVLLRHRRPGLLAAWVSYLLILAPSSGLIRIGFQVAADRYSYLAMVGGVVLVAAGLSLAWSSSGGRRARAVGIAVTGGAVVVALVVLTRDQCRIWRNSETLWSHAMEHGGNSRTANYGLATVRYHQGRFAEAMAHYDEAIRLAPDDALALNDRAMILAACPEAQLRDGRRAVASATRACELTRWSIPVFLDTLAAAHAEAGDFATAAHWQEKAIDLLADEREKDDYRARLELYRAGKPYREKAPDRPPAGAGS